jgi:peptide/nickel transport system substrate-binding protein
MNGRRNRVWMKEGALMTRSSTGRFAIALALVTMMVAVLATAALAQETTGETGDQGSGEPVRFTWGQTSEPTSLNPMSGYLATDFYFWTASYHLLIDYDENLEAEDGLATEVVTSPDSMEFTYTIRDDIVWSDGTPLTAEDVAFTLNLYKLNHAYLPQGYLTLIDGEVEAVDATHVTFRSKVPTGLYTGEFPYMYDYILPKHVFEQFDKPKQFENVPQVASGPFMITEYEVGEFVKMERNPEWTGPEPAVDELVYRIYKNEDALSLALKQGDVDFAYFSSANIYNSLANEPDIETLAGSIPAFAEIGMNTGSAYQEPSEGFVPHGDGHPALTDLSVRQAIRMAINSEQLSEAVLLGYGQPGNSIIPPVSVEGARWEPGEDDPLAWNIDGANALLDEAGYLDTDDDGVREMPAGSLEPGRPLEFRYHVRTNEQTSVDASPFVSEWLADIGIQANVEVVTSGALGDIINAGNFDLFSWSWIPDPDPASMLNNMTCAERPPDGATYGNNDSYYCNPEYDRLYQEQLAELDPAARWEIVHEMQQIFYEDAAYAVMWYDPLLQAYRTDRFTGFNPQPPPQGDLLEGYGGPSDVWTTLQPVGADGEAGGEAQGGGGSSSAEARGLSAWVWLGAVALVLVVVGFLILRRRRSAEDEA